ANFEGFRNRIGSNGSSLTVPIPDFYKGDFTKWVDSKNVMIPIYDPATTTANPAGGFTRQVFAGNILPASRISKVASQLIPYGTAVAPNRPGLVPGTSNYVRSNYVTAGGT